MKRLKKASVVFVLAFFVFLQFYNFTILIHNKNELLSSIGRLGGNINESLK